MATVLEWSGDKVEFWQKLKKNATQIMIFLPHYMWAENNELRFTKEDSEGRILPV